MSLAEDRGRETVFWDHYLSMMRLFRCLLANDYADFSIQGEIIINEEGEKEVCSDYFHLTVYQDEKSSTQYIKKMILVCVSRMKIILR